MQIRLRVVIIAFVVSPWSWSVEPTATNEWQDDLDYLSVEFPKREGGFTADERAAFKEAIASIRADLGTMDDEHIIVRVMQAVALARNGHSGAYPSRDDARFGRIPVRLWYFADGLHVVKARPQSGHLLGAKLVAVNGRPVNDVIGKVATLAYGNRSWRRVGSAIRVTVPASLYGLDITPDKDRAEYTFEKPDGTRIFETLVMESLNPAARYQLPIWDLSPVSKSGDGEWKYALSAEASDLPLYLRDPNRVLWHEYLPKYETFYIQYNSSLFRDDDDSRGMIRAMSDALQQDQPKTVIVDLRLNGGGDLTQMRGAFNRMLRDAKFDVYAITGAATFSAGLFHAANFKSQGATIVGELPGDDLDFWAEGGAPIELPNCKMRVGASTGFHSYSKIAYPEYDEQLYLNLDIDTLEPDMPIEMTFDDYVSGRDPVLDAILAR